MLINKQKTVAAFLHDSNAQDDFRIISMRASYGWEGYGWFWAVIEALRDAKGRRLNVSPKTLDWLALRLRIDREDQDRFRKFLKDSIDLFELFKSDGETFWSERLTRDIDRKENGQNRQRNLSDESSEQPSDESDDKSDEETGQNRQRNRQTVPRAPARIYKNNPYSNINNSPNIPETIYSGGSGGNQPPVAPAEDGTLSKFGGPSLEIATAYFRGYKSATGVTCKDAGVEAERFWNYYESRKWVYAMGRVTKRITNWKLSASNWILSGASSRYGANRAPGRKSSDPTPGSDHASGF